MTFAVYYLTQETYADGPGSTHRHQTVNRILRKFVCDSAMQVSNILRARHGFWEDEARTIWIPNTAVIRVEQLTQ